VSGDVPQRALKMYFNAPHGEVSRRGLFQSLLPKYGVIPYIESMKCVGERCELCRQRCAFEAIVVDDGGVSIDSLCCRGCGACTGACPRGAIVYPNFSLNQLNVELERLLPDDGNALHPRIVTMVCQSGRHSLDDSGSNVFEHTPNFLPMEMPCLSMVSPWLMLRAFDLGAQALALIYDRERCQFRFDSEKWQETVGFVQELLDHWGIQAERVSLFEGGNPEQELLDFDRRIAKLAPISLRPSCSTELPAEDLPLPALIRSMGERLGAPMVGTISAGAVPFGKLTLDGPQCSGCGVCAADCPTGALIVLPGQDSYGLVLRQESCVGCGQCIKVCPEGCLQLEKVLELEKLGCRPETVIEGDFVCCEECGVPIAPRAMVETVRARMAAAGGVTSRLETCPDCRMRTKPSLAKTRFGV
jgi:ferredoxin